MTRKSTILTVVTFFALGFVFSFIVVARVNKSVHSLITAIILQHEKISNTESAFLKKIFGVYVSYDQELLSSAIASGDLETIQALLDAGIDYNQSPLVLQAVQANQFKSLQLLLAYNVEINASDSQGVTGLIAAVTNDNEQATKLLLQFGADVNSLDKNNNNALLVAIHRQNARLIEYLLQTGARVNPKNKEEVLPLITAVKSGNLLIVDLLLKAGANINQRDSEGKTPLYHAVETNNFPVVEKLINLGADLMLADNSKQTIVDLNPEDQRISKLIQLSISKENERIAGKSNSTETTNQLENSTPNSENQHKTRLRVIGKPLGVWKRQKVMSLESIEVKVKNITDVVAKEIELQVNIPGSEPVNLTGPVELQGYEETKYTAEPKINVLRQEELKVSIKCSNCYR